MGTENMFTAFFDYPELATQALNNYASDYIEFLRAIEANNMLHPTTGAQTLIMGSKSFTNDLPGSGKITSRDVWGHLNSQESTGLSPAMFNDIVAPSYNRLAAEFGLVSYGCCEPVHDIWDCCLSKWDNLRKVSIAPWCDEELMGERLRGTKIIYHRKPTPNLLGVGTVLDEEAVRQNIRATMKAAKGCIIEITQRDVYTINHDEAKLKRYVEIIREESC